LYFAIEHISPAKMKISEGDADSGNTVLDFLLPLRGWGSRERFTSPFRDYRNNSLPHCDIRHIFRPAEAAQSDSREAAQDCSPGRKPWVGPELRSKP
jgi:hypothetical protein